MAVSAFPQGDFVFPDELSSGRFTGFGGQNNAVTSNNGNLVGGNFVSGFDTNNGRTGMSTGQFGGFGVPNMQQIQGQNNPVTSDNGQFTSGNFISGFGPNEGQTSGNNLSSGQFNGFGRQNSQVQGQNNPISSNTGNFVSGNFVSGFDPVTTTTLSPTSAPTPQYLACMQQCLTTNEYNPVCGSDGQNYHNAARLKCSQQCGSSK